VDRTLALIGCESVAGLNASYVDAGKLGRC